MTKTSSSDEGHYGLNFCLGKLRAEGVDVVGFNEGVNGASEDCGFAHSQSCLRNAVRAVEASGVSICTLPVVPGWIGCGQMLEVVEGSESDEGSPCRCSRHGRNARPRPCSAW